MKRRSRVLFMGVVVVAACLGLVMYRFLHRPASGLIPVRVGYMPIAECGPLFLGVDNHIFERNGLKLDLQQAPGGSVILESVIGGGVDVGFSNLVSLALAGSQGMDLVAFAGGAFEDSRHQLHGLVVTRESGIDRGEALRGKTIAVNTRKNIDHLLLLQWLRGRGVPPSEVKLVEIPFPRMETVLAAGEVQAAAIVEPFLEHARKRGLKVLGNYFLPEDNSKVEVTSYAARKRWLAKNAKAAEAFVAALRESIQYANTHEQELRSPIAKWTRVDASLTAQMGLPGFADSPTVQGIDYLLGAMRSEGFIDTRFSAGAMLWTGIH